MPSAGAGRVPAGSWRHAHESRRQALACFANCCTPPQVLGRELSSEVFTPTLQSCLLQSHACPYLCRHDAQAPFVWHQGEFNALANELGRQYPDRARLWFAYNEPLSHLIYAGSDIFLVPSMFEPCGLTQMIAMR